jgi:membrane-bound lytic murein transglycosylase A
VAESERGALAHGLTHARKTLTGTEPYATRADIEEGALADKGLELLWLADPVDTFFMHIQGSGRIRLPDGSMVRVTYDGKNGHPYTSIGRYLIDAGLFPADRMSLDALKEWLKRDAIQGRDAMRQNKSFVFFRELEGEEAESALGVHFIPLSDGRSLAVDTAFHVIGTPIYVSAPALTHGGQPDGFSRLMIAQDVGSAIRGPERGDIYFGSGDEAGKLAGTTKHGGTFVALLPRAGGR